MTADKDTARALLKGRRATLSEKDRAYAALKLGGNIAAFFDAEHLPETATIAAYWALPDEIDLRPALATLMANGARVAFPCTHEGHRMEFYHLDATDLDGASLPEFLTHPSREYPESTCSGYERVIPDELDAILVPALGFDGQKHRLGFGAGCYDRYLTRLPENTLVIGVAFDQQLCKSLPVEEHDRSMDYVMTPNALI